jgi:hypothetical protein
MTMAVVMVVGAALFTYSVVMYHLGYKAGRAKENVWLKDDRTWWRKLWE